MMLCQCQRPSLVPFPAEKVTDLHNCKDLRKTEKQ